ncbi:oxidoreductase [Shewanella sp.]|uniref:oxidoreductase n=1 Tax=Shewanella sp. TaxID=50422 RepID=UPI00258A789F|nr:oxidoreductase [Shewanella sp.]MCJ8304864.1 oxidoreductase [Shewanella sp.]
MNNTQKLANKTAVVTGANSGIGYYTSLHLAAKGTHVIMACRDEQKATQAIEKIKSTTPNAKLDFIKLDLNSLNSVKNCAEQIKDKYPPINFLVNNAGVMTPPKFTKTVDNFELQFGVNYLGHFAFTGHLLEHMQNLKDSRVVTLGSLAHHQGSIDFANLNSEKKYSGAMAYAQSKMACIMFAYELQRRLKASNKLIESLSAHPGWAATELQRDSLLLRMLNPVFSQSSEAGAMPTLRALTDESATGGEYYGPGGFLGFKGSPKKVKSKATSYNENMAIQLWEQSQKLTGVNYL